MVTPGSFKVAIDCGCCDSEPCGCFALGPAGGPCAPESYPDNKFGLCCLDGKTVCWEVTAATGGLSCFVGKAGGYTNGLVPGSVGLIGGKCGLFAWSAWTGTASFDCYGGGSPYYLCFTSGFYAGFPINFWPYICPGSLPVTLDGVPASSGALFGAVGCTPYDLYSACDLRPPSVPCTPALCYCHKHCTTYAISGTPIGGYGLVHGSEITVHDAVCIPELETTVTFSIPASGEFFVPVNDNFKAGCSEFRSNKAATITIRWWTGGPCTGSVEEEEGPIFSRPPAAVPFLDPAGSPLLPDSVVVVPAGGVGSKLRELIKGAGLQDDGCGSCQQVAAEMDLAGPDAVEARFEEFADKLRQKSSRLGWTQYLMTGAKMIIFNRLLLSPRDPAPGLLREAIRLAKEKQESEGQKPPAPAVRLG